ncbi:MAG: DinB family protein [Acidobacteriia bacterium]|nr:DinB family protein [Terriglobia bacterium]
MGEIHRIEDQLNRAVRGGAWHGPSLLQILKGVSASQAAARPVNGSHSIWEIVNHVTVWQTLVRGGLVGQKMPHLAASKDWPLVNKIDVKAWKNTLKQLEASAETLRQALRATSEDRLSARVRGRRYSVYYMLHGIIQHDLYHAGQIALLKKAQSTC